MAQVLEPSESCTCPSAGGRRVSERGGVRRRKQAHLHDDSPDSSDWSLPSIVVGELIVSSSSVADGDGFALDGHEDDFFSNHNTIVCGPRALVRVAHVSVRMTRGLTVGEKSGHHENSSGTDTVNTTVQDDQPLEVDE